MTSEIPPAPPRAILTSNLLGVLLDPALRDPGAEASPGYIAALEVKRCWLESARLREQVASLRAVVEDTAFAPGEVDALLADLRERAAARIEEMREEFGVAEDYGAGSAAFVRDATAAIRALPLRAPKAAPDCGEVNP